MSKLREWMIKQGLNAYALADELRVSSDLVHKVMRQGKRHGRAPSAEFRLRFSERYGWETAHELFGPVMDDNEKEPDHEQPEPA